MKNELDVILNMIGDEYKNVIMDGSRFYIEVDIGERAEKLGYESLQREFKKVNAIIPVKDSVPGMKVRIDGRTFVNYARHASGVVVPGYVAEASNLGYTNFIPNHSMILNF